MFQMSMNHTSRESHIEHTLRTLLPVLEKNEVEQLLARLSDFPVEVIKAPETGLIMAHARDCFDVDFYLGELLVTTAEVECFGVRGHATIMGDEPLKAVLAATVNAIMRSPQANVLAELNPLFEAYMQKFRHLLTYQQYRKSDKTSFHPHVTLIWDDLTAKEQEEVKAYVVRDARFQVGFEWTCDNVSLYVQQQHTWVPFHIYPLQ